MTEKTTEKTFEEELQGFRSAGFSCIYLVTKEEKVAEEEIVRALEAHKGTGKIFRFSVSSALQEISSKSARLVPVKLGDDQTVSQINEPDELINSLPNFMKVGESGPTNVVILPDFVEFLDRDPILRRGFRERIWWARATGHMLILLSTKYKEIPDLANDMMVIHHGLPSIETTKKLVMENAEENDIEIDQLHLEKCVESLTGMTSMGQGDAIALSLVYTGKREIRPSILLENKEREIAKRDYLRIVKPDVSFDNIVGHEALKEWAMLRRNGFSEAARKFGIAKPPKGALLVGPPGTGKTLFAKALTNAWGGMPLLQFKISAVFSSMLGDSEAHVRDAIEVAERMAPCIFWIDEINRAFGGDGGERDGGTQQRITGELLTWMSEKTSPVFVLATANDVTGMPAEMLRKGRFDEIWSIGVPGLESRKDIFRLFLKGKENNADIDVMAENSDRFIPAELEEIVNGAHYRAFERHLSSGEDGIITTDDLMHELGEMKPLAQTMEAKFKVLENWAKKNARSTVIQDAEFEETESISNRPRKLNG